MIIPRAWTDSGTDQYRWILISQPVCMIIDWQLLQNVEGLKLSQQQQISSMYKWIARNHEGSSNVINDRTKWIYIYNGLLHCPTKLPGLSSITTQPPSRPCSGNSHLLIGLQWMICKGRRSTTTTWEGRSLGGVGGRKEPAASTTAGACSWWGSITRWGVIPRIMAGSGLMERAECGRHQHLWVFERGKIVFHHYRIGRGDFEKFHEKFRPSGIWQR